MFSWRLIDSVYAAQSLYLVSTLMWDNLDIPYLRVLWFYEQR